MKKHLVMLHGFGCDSRVFSSIGTKLSKDHDVWMVDVPGHGQTRLRPKDFGGQAKELGTFFGFCAHSIKHALETHLKEPYSLFGWSMGGQIALEMYEQSIKKCADDKCDHDHSLIESLILVSTTPKFVASEDFKEGMNKAVFDKFRKGLKDNSEKTMSDFYRLMFSDKEDAPMYLSSIQTQTPSQKTLLDCMDSFEKFDERKTLPKISVPTLIMTGDSDEIINYKASMFMSQEIKNSELKVFKGAGHAPHLTREKEIIDEIAKFIR
jgi:pimeloyl-ACP methyl ester esterase